MPIIRLQGREEKAQGIYYEFDYADEPLGVGGMGKVYSGRRIIQATGATTNVAIKFMFDDLPQSVIERARREASIHIQNENLVEMLGFIQIDEKLASGEIHQRYHVVSELLDGVMLNDLLQGKVTDRHGEIVPFAQSLYMDYMNDPSHFAVLIIRNILSGIMALHDKGYIHRDIDPTNVMITREGKIKLIDFGIAKQLSTLSTQDKSLTTTGQFMGKAVYASPELVLGDVNYQNRTTDIYAIGIMFFQLIVGHPPFEGATHEVLEMQLHKKVPLQLIKQKQFREVISKATAKKQSERYQTAAEFRVAVEQLEGLALQDAAPRLFLNRKNMLYPTVAIVLILFAVGIYWGTQSGEKEIETNEEANVFTLMDSISEVISPYQETVALLMDSLSSKEGFTQLKELVDRNPSSEAAYLLGRLYYSGEENNDSVKIMQKYLSEILVSDNAKSHDMNELSVSLDSLNYKSLYELGCDYYSGEMRTGGVTSRNVDKAILYFQRGMQLAEQSGDADFQEKFGKRLKQLGQ